MRRTASSVVNLDRERTRRLAKEIERDLRRAGGRSLIVDLSTIDDVARWRRAAVLAAHSLGHRASTYMWGGRLRVELDLPITEVERRQAALVTARLVGFEDRGPQAYSR